ncbi:uncharacterized protein A4U43_C05F530 [Asparagus officinalis]|uniref:DUF7036 domain-containing protein n=1 Tax=Asparagus officinalis TaxID=4686 RepID=A0A5P1ENX1_ASPOF|nr:uncharacterized protein A4U43_C05F530 [Asparagus officinalis]
MAPPLPPDERIHLRCELARCVLMCVVELASSWSDGFWPAALLGRGKPGIRGHKDPFHGGKWIFGCFSCLHPAAAFLDLTFFVEVYLVGFISYVVASFRVQKPVSFLNANIARLQYDIFEEIGVPNSSVAVISLEPFGGLNWTNVVFGIWPYPKTTTISLAGLSVLRDNFKSFVIRRSTLDLTTSLFGKTYFFQVLKFPGGITIIPQQNAFLLQKADMLFSFTLNFPINKVEGKLGELKAQMKSGLLLSSYENLYVSLTNLKGSTVDPPTIVQTTVVLAVGNRPPSAPRLRQLAQTIRSDENLGLNHTVFGRVKQIQLSSFLNHSLNGGAPAPAHQHLHRPPAPCGRHCLSPNKPKSSRHIVPAAAPADSPKTAPSSEPSDDLPTLPPNERPSAPSPSEDLPASAPRSFHTPLPHVFLARARSPSKSATETKPPDKISSVSHSPFSCEYSFQIFHFKD